SSALASDFRDMYHQLENIMEQIIAVNFKGLSDSVLSYNEFNQCNKAALEHLNGIGKSIEDIKGKGFDLEGIRAEKELATSLGMKYEICQGISEVKHIMDNLDDEMIKRSQSLVNALDIIDNRDYIQIGAVNGYRKIIYECYIETVRNACDRILEYVFYNKKENLHYFRSIVVLGSLYELEDAFTRNFSIYTFRAIESIILASYGSIAMDLEQVCKKVMGRFELIKKNMGEIIESTFKHFEVNGNTGEFKVRNGQRELPNFSKRNDKCFRYCIDENFILGKIEEEMEKFIERYCVRDSIAEVVFDSNNIVDEINYEKIYGSKHPITARLCQPVKTTESRVSQYTVLSSPSSEVLFYLARYAKDPFLHSFVKTKILKFYSGAGLDGDKREIDRIFENASLKTEGRNGLSSIYRRISGMIRDEYAECQMPLRKHIVDKLNAFFKRAYLEIFTNEIVQGCASLEEPKATFEFREALIRKHINKKDLFLNKEKYIQAISILNTLKAFDSLLEMSGISQLYQLYYSSFKMQLNIDIFYYFDLLYRQGSYHFYTEKIVQIVKMVYEVGGTSSYFAGIYENIEYYSIHNVLSLHVRNREEIGRFIEHVKILDEIMGEVEFFSTLSGLYRFFEEVMDGKSKNKHGKMLQRKIQPEK
ncbi:hypothetical protein PAEPH01_2091, partial [Pancytospora epiphaga]